MEVTYKVRNSYHGTLEWDNTVIDWGNSRCVIFKEMDVMKKNESS